MKIFAKLLAMAIAMGYLIYAVIRHRVPAENRVCTSLNIQLSEGAPQNFVDSNFVMGLLKKKKWKIQGEMIGEINLQEIEDYLRGNPYIDSVNCYHTDRGSLCIHVIPQRPVVMVMDQTGQQYYLDRNGHRMPLDKFNLKLCVATGKISQEFAVQKLLPLAEYIQNHPFWNKQVEQIHVVSEDEITIHPRVGQHTIILGDSKDYEDKLSRMLLFYQKGFPQVGWNRYEKINLAYKGQIVCTRSKNKKQ